MRSLAFVFCYNRIETLRACIDSLFAQAALPDEIVFIDDGSREPVADLLRETQATRGNLTKITLWLKPENLGFSDSAVRALAYARTVNPEYLFFIESDYVFVPRGLDVVRDLLENTEEGKTCLGVVGYDHPNFYRPEAIHVELPKCMRDQMGEDNVNRAALHRPRVVSGKTFRFHVELVSNTCWSSYLNWRNIQKVAAEFPELNRFLDLACAPQPNPNYPPSEQFIRERVVDDGMLSHGLCLAWNRWALKHGIDRDRFGAWLNIKPSVAEHRWAGGMHT